MWEGGDIPEDPSFDDFHQQFVLNCTALEDYRARKGHVRDALINSALDEPLARAIFTRISSEKSHDALPLESLTLRSTDGADFGGLPRMGTSGLDQAVRNLGRSWLLVRSPRDDCRDMVLAREPGRCSREAMEVHNNGPLRRTSWRNVEPVFQRLWPAGLDSTGDWRDD